MVNKHQLCLLADISIVITYVNKKKFPTIMCAFITTTSHEHTQTNTPAHDVYVQYNSLN